VDGLATAADKLAGQASSGTRAFNEVEQDFKERVQQFQEIAGKSRKRRWFKVRRSDR
jgi:hypothetical protein